MLGRNGSMAPFHHRCRAGGNRMSRVGGQPKDLILVYRTIYNLSPRFVTNPSYAGEIGKKCLVRLNLGLKNYALTPINAG